MFIILTSVFILLLAITFSTTVFAAVQSTAYVDSKNQFSINPPAGWTVDSSGAYGTAVILYGPTDSNFRINMNIIVQATSLTLSAYVAGSKSQLSTGLTNYALVSETLTTIGGVPADELVNTFTQGSYSIKDQQDYLVQNGNAYVITSTALQTDYGTYQPSFNESVQTFQITAPAFPWLLVILPGVIAAVVAVGLAVFFMRRRGRVTVPPPPSMPEVAPGSPPSSPPQTG